MHGGGPTVTAGTPLSSVYKHEALELVSAGCCNMQHHIRNALKFGIPVVVCVNRFDSDTDAELAIVVGKAREAGAFDAVVSTHWRDGGNGGLLLAEAVIAACKQPSVFKFLYPLTVSIKEKIETIAKSIYGADYVAYSEVAERKIARYSHLGYSELPICMAKTHLSLSSDPSLKGVPTGFVITVRDIRASVGAGFLYPLLGDIMTIPGLPTRPGFYDVDIDVKTGRVIGLF
jgi:formyltetrahydrofolate synthetase